MLILCVHIFCKNVICPKRSNKVSIIFMNEPFTNEPLRSQSNTLYSSFLTFFKLFIYVPIDNFCPCFLYNLFNHIRIKNTIINVVTNSVGGKIVFGDQYSTK